MKKHLKQPNKYTHSFLNKRQSDSQEEQEQKPDLHKSKQIDKQKYVRKIINKPHQPSALRLAQINKTFEKLSQKSVDYLDHLHVDKLLLQKLVNLKQKFVCLCKRNVKFYCLRCNQKCSLLDIPQIQLPLNVHVVEHMSQKINRSSIAPIRFLTKNINFYPFQGKVKGVDFQKQNEEKVFDHLPKPSPSTYILYPHKKSKPISKIQTKISDIILLDCTWFQTDSIIEQFSNKGYLNFIKLQGYQSLYWRYNHFGEQALSSAESLMFFFRELQAKTEGQVHRYDQLMLLYALSMKMVEKSIQQ